MTSPLVLPARAGAPVVCDMSTARDTLDRRIAEYALLFERALRRRERHGGSLVFVFDAGDDVRGAVDDLARREAACCPFLSYRVETVGGEVVWTLTNAVEGDGRGAADETLDAFERLAEQAAPAGAS